MHFFILKASVLLYQSLPTGQLKKEQPGSVHFRSPPLLILIGNQAN